MLKLTQLAIFKCLRHINQITDVGTLPYHLVRPILSRMSAQQLDLVESNSPHIKLNSDELWLELIKKDFPNRPLRQGIINAKMVNKSVYQSYVKQQEDFRKDSTERLKQMTQRLKYEKSANSVIQVEQVLRDPVVKAFRGNKNSILNKARRECMGRSLMFPRNRDPKPMIRPIRSPLQSPSKLHPQQQSPTKPHPQRQSSEMYKSPAKIIKPHKSSAFIPRKPRPKPSPSQVYDANIKPIKSLVFH